MRGLKGSRANHLVQGSPGLFTYIMNDVGLVYVSCFGEGGGLGVPAIVLVPMFNILQPKPDLLGGGDRSV